MMRFIRWFGLDTILGVVSVQLLLHQLFGGLTVFYIIGLCASTSLIYMIDRWFDGIFDKQYSLSRHALYQQQPLWLVGSIIVLGGATAYFWWSLSVFIKVKLLLGVLGAACHLILLRFSFYAYVKPWLVSAIFSWVMVAGLPFVPFGILGFIFFLTLINLMVHDCIEGKPSWRWVMACLVCLIISVDLFPVWWLTVVFFCGMAFYIPLILFAERLTYWYELGELIFALPFLTACGLMKMCLK